MISLFPVEAARHWYDVRLSQEATRRVGDPGHREGLLRVGWRAGGGGCVVELHVAIPQWTALSTLDGE